MAYNTICFSNIANIDFPYLKLTRILLFIFEYKTLIESLKVNKSTEIFSIEKIWLPFF